MNVLKENDCIRVWNFKKGVLWCMVYEAEVTTCIIVVYEAEVTTWRHHVGSLYACQDAIFK